MTNLLAYLDTLYLDFAKAFDKVRFRMNQKMTHR